jgi:hypothetical protein
MNKRTMYESLMSFFSLTQLHSLDTLFFSVLIEGILCSLLYKFLNNSHKYLKSDTEEDVKKQ